MPLITIKKYAQLIKWGGIILLVFALVYAIYDYLKSKELLSQLSEDNKALEFRLDNIKTQIDNQTKQLTAIRASYRKIELEYSRQVEQLDKLRQLSDEYIKNNKSEVKQELNLRFDTLTNQMQCLSGDKSKCGS